MMLALEVQYNGKLKQNDVESFLLKLTQLILALFWWVQVGIVWVDPSWHYLGGSKLALFGWVQVGIVLLLKFCWRRVGCVFLAL